MTFCTLVEWDEGFPLDRYRELSERAGDQDALPDGCLARVVGGAEPGACVIEIWQSEDDAKRFSAKSSPWIAELQIPPPTRIAAFEAQIFQARATTL